MIKNLAYTSFFVLICTLLGCKQEPTAVNEDFDVVVRINRDIGRVNPILSNTGRAREVYQYVFLNFADYDPKTLQLSPVLAESLPQKTKLDDGSVKYKFRILEDAVWANGDPITANDFLFTLKLVFHPGLTSTNWKSFLSIIDEVILDPEDDKSIEFVVKEETINTLEVLCSFEVYPEHIYDSNGVLTDFSFSDMKDPSIAETMEKDSSFTAFANEFSSSKYGMEVVEGAGPYFVSDWETDQYIRLKRKDNWWGSKYPERTILQANPSEIIFQIIADETTALTQLKGGNIDVMRITNGTAFKDLESQFQNELNFHKAKIRQFFFIAVNNEDEILQHKEVRQALAMSIDINKMIEVLEAGDAVAISGTISPFVEGFKSSILPISQNIEKAINLLESNGWSDENNNGLYDKLIEGKITDIKLVILASSDKGERFGLLVKEFAKSIGVEIDIVRKKSASMVLNENIYTGDYQLYPFSTSWDLSPYDPYGRWHSENIKARGSNISRYSNKATDRIIEKIRVETDKNTLMEMYGEFDKMLDEDEPVIFLYSPLDRIVTNKKIEPLIANKRPSYFVNAFELAEVPVSSDN